MSYLLSLCLLMLQLSSAFAQTELDILKDQRKHDINLLLNTPDNCSECQAYNARKCPTVYANLIEEVSKSSLYSFIVGNKILDTCLSHKLPMPATPERMEKILADSYQANFHVNQEKLDACFEQNKIKDNDKDQKVFTAYLYGLSKNIEDLQKKKLEEIASIDNMLKVPPLKDVSCGAEHKEHCGQLRTCGANENLNETTEFSMTSLKEIVQLENQLDALRATRVGTIGSPINAAQYKLAFDDVKEKLDFVKAMNPWLEGDELSDSQSKIKRLIRDGKAAEAQDLFKKKLTEQVKKARNSEELAYTKLRAAESCIENNTECSAKVLKDMNHYYVNPFDNYALNSKLSKEENTEASLLVSSASCMANLKQDKEGLEDVNRMVASTVVGLGVGGFGGVLKLGQMATKFYQAGSRVKGLASIAALGAEGKMINDSFNNVSENCSNAVNVVKNASESKENLLCSANGSNIYKVSNLKSCVADIALTTLPYLFSLRGMIKERGGIAPPTAEMVKAEKDLIASKVVSNFFTGDEKKEIAASLQRLHLTPTELDDVIKKMNVIVKSDLDKNRLRNYVNFVNSLKPEEQKLAIEQLHDIALLSSNMSPGAYVQRFYNKESKFYFYEKFKEAQFKKDLMKKGKNEVEAEKMSEVLARESRAKLQKRYYSCQSKTITPEHKTAAKRYAGISLVLGVGGTTVGYAMNNKERFENNKGEWFSKLGYDITMAIVLSKLSAKLMKSPSQSMGQKYVTANIDGALVGTIDAGVYSKLYGVTREEALEKMEEIRKSPDATKELKVLEAYIDKSNLLEKFKDKVASDYAKIFASADREAILGTPPYMIGEEKFENLTAADLEKPEIKEKLVTALLHKMNSGEDGPLISTGDKGIDRWVNDRAWNTTIGVPKSLIVGAGIYQVLCMGVDKPFTSLGIVTGLQFVNSMISGPSYYTFRKAMIGQ